MVCNCSSCCSSCSSYNIVQYENNIVNKNMLLSHSQCQLKLLVHLPPLIKRTCRTEPVMLTQTLARNGTERLKQPQLQKNITQPHPHACLLFMWRNAKSEPLFITEAPINLFSTVTCHFLAEPRSKFGVLPFKSYRFKYTFVFIKSGPYVIFEKLGLNLGIMPFK